METVKILKKRAAINFLGRSCTVKLRIFTQEYHGFYPAACLTIADTDTSVKFRILLYLKVNLARLHQKAPLFIAALT